MRSTSILRPGTIPRDTPKKYTAGTWGPCSIGPALIERGGRTWHEVDDLIFDEWKLDKNMLA